LGIGNWELGRRAFRALVELFFFPFAFRNAKIYMSPIASARTLAENAIFQFD